MEFALGICILLALGLYVTIQATRISTTNQLHIEQRRREYLYVLNIARNHPQHTTYRQLVSACGQAYAAVEDPTIFDASMITQRRRDKLIAQQVKQSNNTSNTIIIPQTGYGAFSLSEVSNGAITYYKRVNGSECIDTACGWLECGHANCPCLEEAAQRRCLLVRNSRKL